MGRKRRPKDKTNLLRRNRDVRAYYTDLTKKHGGKWRSTYIVELVAQKYYLSERQVYLILATPDVPIVEQQVLFE